MSSLGLVDLPPEVIMCILKQKSLSCKDVLTIGHVCRPLREICSSRPLWTTKIFQQWPEFEAYKSLSSNWFEEYRNICDVFNFCKTKIMSMSSVYYWSKMSLSDCHLDEFIKLSKKYNGLGYHYVMYFLRDICNKQFELKDTTPHAGFYNMTNQYYAAIILDFINQHNLKEEWLKMNLNGNADTVEEKNIFTPEQVAIFLDQWMEPKYKKFDEEFNQMISPIVECLIQGLPTKHPLHKFTVEDRKRWSKKMLKDNQYDGNSCKQLIAAACDHLRNQGFINTSDPISNTLIFRHVMEQQKSNKFFSAIILESVLRRCGVRCDIVYFPNHRLLLWRENWENKSPSYLVNPFTGSIKSSSRKCPFASSRDEVIEPDFYFYSPLNLLLNLTTCMRDVSEFKKRSFKNSIELLTFLEPDDAVHFFLLGEVYLDLKKDAREITKNLEPIMRQRTLSIHQRERAEHVLHRIREWNKDIEKTPIMKKEIKRRSSKLVYAVGMVCYHKMYGYLCVIRGWDNICTASSEWKINMGVHSLEFGENQPFYHVLAIDFTDRYVAQENLVFVHPSQRLQYIEERLSLDFSHFNEFCYVPNAEKEEEYPDDGPVRAKYRSVW